MSPNKKSILIGLVRCIGTREDEEQWEGVAAELSPGTSFNLFSLSLFLPLSFVLRVVVIGISHFTPRKDKNSTHPPKYSSQSLLPLVLCDLHCCNISRRFPISFPSTTATTTASFPSCEQHVHQSHFIRHVLYQWWWWWCRYDAPHLVLG